jgi:hypothetical protein
MAIKIFKNIFKGNSSDTIAINPDNVISVYETEIDEIVSKTKSKNKNKKTITNIYCIGGTNFQVEESFTEVINLLK